MTLDDLGQANLPQLVEAGVFRRAQAVRQKAGWRIVVYYGRTEHALATQHGRVRVFQTLDKVVTYLAQVGVTHFDVDASYNTRVLDKLKGFAQSTSVSGEPVMSRVVACSEELEDQIKKAIKAINTAGG